MGANGTSKRAKIWVTILTVVLALLLAVLILNVFMPIRYISAYLVIPDKCEQDQLQVTYMDVGFGDGTLIQLPDGKVVVIDGGDGSYPNQLKLLKSLNQKGISQIDYLICSSVKKEHCGGLTELLYRKTVKKVFMPYCKNERITDEYYSFTKTLKSKGIENSVACVGEGFMGENYFFAFLSPSSYDNPQSEYNGLNTEPNKENIDNSSIVCWLECYGKRFVFCSDARSGAFERIMADYSANKLTNSAYTPYGNKVVELEKCDVATLEGHGGEKNACSEWWALLKPRHAIVSVGLNYGGYPSIMSMSNPAGVNSSVYLTSESGNICAVVDAQNFTLKGKN